MFVSTLLAASTLVASVVALPQTISGGTSCTGSGPGCTPLYESLGCYSLAYTNIPSGYNVSGIDGGGGSNTNEANCASICLTQTDGAGNRYPYMFLQDDQCACTTNYNPNAVVNSTGCSDPCPGDSSENCGNFDLNYWSGWLTGAPIINPTPPVIVPPAPPSWHDLGCHADGLPGALRSHLEIDLFGMTREKCQSTCSGKNYTYAAVESSIACTCGDTLYINKTEPASQCNVPCSGNHTETCGGLLLRMELFHYY